MRQPAIVLAVLSVAAAGVAGAHVVIATPTEVLDEFVDHVGGRVLSACATLAQEKNTFGDVVVMLRKGPLTETSFSIPPDAELHPEVAACVDRAVREAAKQDLGDVGIAHAASAVFVIGQPAGVLPAMEHMLDDWRRAGAEPSARRALQRDLGRGITVTDQGCLRVPGRLSLREGVATWLRQLGPGIFDGAFADGVTLFADLGPVRPVGGAAGFTTNHRWRAGVFVDDDTVLLHWSAPTWYPRSAPPSELCLVPLAAHTRDELGHRLDQFSRCLAGNLRQRLTRPRIAFSDDRRYRAVAAGHGLHSCAIHESGEVTCCGRRPPRPPFRMFTAVAPGHTYDCGLLAGGWLTCWGDGAPVPATVRGPFTQLAADAHTVCAVAAGDRAVTCWGPSASPEAARAVGAVARVAVDNRGVCALRSGGIGVGELLCWGLSYGDRQLVKVNGRFKAFDMYAGYACGVDAGDGTIACWYREPMAPDQRGRRQPVGGGGYVDVAVSDGRGCGLDGGGGVHCWPAEVRATFAAAGRFRGVSGGSHICGVTTEGRVVCEEREYY